MTTAERIETEERRAARASYQRAGGSKRRPLHSFATADEKKARRLEHADRLSQAVAALETAEGFAEWARTCELCPDVSPLNAALIADQLPGEVAGTAAFWQRNGYRIPKGEHAAGWITGPMFWPKAVFTARQVGARELQELEDMAAAAEVDGREGADAFRRELSTGAKNRDAAGAVAVAFGLREPEE